MVGVGEWRIQDVIGVRDEYEASIYGLQTVFELRVCLVMSRPSIVDSKQRTNKDKRRHAGIVSAREGGIANGYGLIEAPVVSSYNRGRWLALPQRAPWDASAKQEYSASTPSSPGGDVMQSMQPSRLQ